MSLPRNGVAVHFILSEVDPDPPLKFRVGLKVFRVASSLTQWHAKPVYDVTLLGKGVVLWEIMP